MNPTTKSRKQKNKCECLTCKSNRRCDGYKFITINNNIFCIFHARYYYSKPIERIQKMYRNFKIQRMVSIYKRLPNDIQRKILFHILENDLIYKFHYNKIRKVILTKKDSYECPQPSFPDDSVPSSIINDLSRKRINRYRKITQHIINIFYLFSKYHLVFTKDDHLEFCKTVNVLYYMVMSQMINNIQEIGNIDDQTRQIYKYLTEIKNVVNDYYTFAKKNSEYYYVYQNNMCSITFA